ncbi:hypothetical protein Ppa06_47890 [Planomonospora parontospora subsp. parontospora]|uniref:Uncharacterized protein n=2 Tax=Planomonospora parontospora TaxID=58119 RepID=A0AA37F6G6_9ACTN|nr:hypothetical protein GCM10010126_46710 [Planomonospora parontospora]GII10991.1 hypothetical protein Ppa06_47890 [Planomonospora parontospora subsp. parontospora]
MRAVAGTAARPAPQPFATVEDMAERAQHGGLLSGIAVLRLHPDGAPGSLLVRSGTASGRADGGAAGTAARDDAGPIATPDH